jgi:hypothetical protein
LLAADLFLLTVLAYIIYRVLSAAHRLAEENYPSFIEQQVSDDVETSPTPRITTKSSSAIFTDLHEQKQSEGATTFVGLHAYILSEPVPTVSEEDRPYADPVDGMPFESGELMVPCVCGLSYREDSVKWLADYCAGCCIHCGVRVSLPERGA